MAPGQTETGMRTAETAAGGGVGEAVEAEVGTEATAGMVGVTAARAEEGTDMFADCLEYVDVSALLTCL